MQKQGVPASGNWADALWLQRHSFSNSVFSFTIGYIFQNNLMFKIPLISIVIKNAANKNLKRIAPRNRPGLGQQGWEMTTFIPRSKQFRLRQQRYLDIDIHIFVSLREPFVPPSMCLFFHPSFLLLPQFLDPHLPSPLSTPVTLLSPSPPPDVVLKLLVSN